jgi:LytS/YehU family sensor histidine kinase
VLLVVLLAHVPALLFILQLEQMVPTLLPPQSLRFVPLPTVVSGITCVLIRRRQSAEQLRFSIAQAQAGESEARLAALRMQLNPHMLLNCLTAVSALSRTAPERIPVLIDNLAAILQSRLKPTPPQLWTLAEELHLARALVELDHVRYTDSPALHESVQFQAESCLVPEMLLQPLVENALKYGRTGTEPPVICLSATVAGNRLAITISNKGAIGKAAHFSPGFGIGMQNIRQRLELLYGRAAKFEVEQTPGHFKAILGLPAVQQP